MRKLFVISLLLLFASSIFAETYYISNVGQDTNDGLSPSDSWASLEIVNEFAFQAGDSVLFKRGDMWRGQLIPNSGSEGAPVYYGAYGTGVKPQFYGSIELNNTLDWDEIDANIWSTSQPVITGSEIIGNSSFETDANGWNFHSEGTADVIGEWTTEDFLSSPGSFKVTCANTGDYATNIQLSYNSLSIVSGQAYCLSFSVNSSEVFIPSGILLMESVPPYDFYSSNTLTMPEIGIGWDTYTICFIANQTATNAMIDFFLGDCLEAGSHFYIDDISLKEADFSTGLIMDVGNVIFDDEASFGVKKYVITDLITQGDYMYDPQAYTLKLYSESNPALMYTDIECALSQNIINEENTSYVTYENLALKYGAGHGIGGGNTNNIIIRKCDISFIGGGNVYLELYGNVRYGNGIEFWSNSHDNLVEQCKVWEVYDAAMTNQNDGALATQTDIIYRNNLIYNSEWSFEYWNRPEGSITNNIYFINNTCLFAGNTWAHEQRPDKRGRHLNFFQADASTDNFYIYNNIFYEATSAGLYVLKASDLDSLTIDNNCWYQTWTDTVVDIRWGEDLVNYYTMANFSSFHTDYSQGQNSFASNPNLENPLLYSPDLLENSPCIDAGTTETFEQIIGDVDYLGNQRIVDGDDILGSLIDIGAIEYVNPNAIFTSSSKKDEVNVYPNPFKSDFFINILDYYGDVEIKLYNNLGQIVFSQSVFYSESVKINLDDITSGVYLLRVIYADKAMSKLLISY